MSSPDKPEINDIEFSPADLEKVKGIFKAVMPAMVERLLYDNEITPDRLSDYGHILSILKNKPDSYFEEFTHSVNIESEFIETAKEAAQKDKPMITLVLIATAVEHITNLFYRDILRGELPANMITDVIKNNFPAKISGWIMALVSDNKGIPDELNKRITKLMELRNSIVHYKAIPENMNSGIGNTSGSYSVLKQQLDSLDMASILTIPEELSKALNEIIYTKFPDRKTAKKAVNSWFIEQE